MPMIHSWGRLMVPFCVGENEMVDPWYPLEKTRTFFLPVHSTAVAIAIMLASVPEFVKRTISIVGEKRSQTILASSFSNAF